MLSDNVPPTFSFDEIDFPSCFLWISIKRVFDAFSNRRPYYFIKLFVHSVYKEISGARVY